MIVKEKVRKVKYRAERFIDYTEKKLSKVNKYLTFRIADEIYGIEVGVMTEILEMQKITDVPDMQNFFKGVIKLKNKMIPVIDLRLLFNIEESEYDDRTCIIILNKNKYEIGFIVDSVLEIVDILESKITPMLQFKTVSEYAKYISGKIGEDVKMILDVDKIVQKDKLEKTINICRKFIEIK